MKALMKKCLIFLGGNFEYGTSQIDYHIIQVSQNTHSINTMKRCVHPHLHRQYSLDIVDLLVASHHHYRCWL